MQTRCIHDYFFFGGSVAWLQRASAGLKVGSLDDGYVRYNLTSFLTTLDGLGLPVSQRAASKLRDWHKKLDTLPDDHKLTEPECIELTRLIRNLKLVLSPELEGLEAYVVTPKRLDVNRLLLDVSGLMSPGVFAKLSSVAQSDLAEAGKLTCSPKPIQV